MSSPTVVDTRTVPDAPNAKERKRINNRNQYLNKTKTKRVEARKSAPPRPPRPKRSDGSEALNLRLTPAQKEGLRKAAEQAGAPTLSDYAKSILFGGQQPARPVQPPAQPPPAQLRYVDGGVITVLSAIAPSATVKAALYRAIIEGHAPADAFSVVLAQYAAGRPKSGRPRAEAEDLIRKTLGESTARKYRNKERPTFSD